MSEFMQSRGPDGQGEWFSDDGRIGLAHRRLSIIDLGVTGAQPMQSGDGDLVITYNGEIYNYQALRDELQQKGFRFRSRSDTEVLLHLYRDQGAAMVKRLRGMFAFVIWDAHNGTLFMARDPYGIKPLYYADDGQAVRVASQVKALLTGGRVSRDKDLAGIAGFYLLGSVPEPHTCWSGISELPAGHYLTVDKTGMSAPTSYFSVGETWALAEARPQPVADIQREVREALLDSVRHHLVADVPVAVFLSAGVDSGALLGLMRELQPGAEIRAITLAFEEFVDTPEDESPLAAKVAALYGATHTSRLVSRKEFEADLPGIFEAMDQPTIDGINTWFVAKAARELGIKVALSGLGGDELFGGYPAFTDVPRWTRRFGPLARIPAIGSALRWLLTKLPFPGINPKAPGLPEYAGSFAGAWLLRRGIHMPWELPRLMGKQQARAGLKQLDILGIINRMMGRELQGDFPRVAALESSLYMRNQLLRDADWAGMAHSVEIRTPLVDASLLRRLAPILAACGKGTIEGKRWLGNSPATPLPDELIRRPKTGFTTPISRWLQDSLQDADAESLAVHDGRQHWSRAWSRQVAQSFGLRL